MFALGRRITTYTPTARWPRRRDGNDIPLKTSGNASILVGDIGHAEDGGQLQYQHRAREWAALGVCADPKQGGNSNTIKIVDGVHDRVKHLLDVPPQLKARVVFDQSIFVKLAVHNVIQRRRHRAGADGIDDPAIPGHLRATVAVMLSIPISVLAAFLLLNVSGNTVNTMVLGGLALALSRLIDNSVVVLENIFRHMEMGEPLGGRGTGRQGGRSCRAGFHGDDFDCVFPGGAAGGCEQYLFSAMALAVVMALLRVPGGHDRGAAVLREIYLVHGEGNTQGAIGTYAWDGH